MKAKIKTLIIPLIVVAVAATVVMVKRFEGRNEYIQSILERREQIDLFMEQSPDSPFPVDQRASFRRLSYFPPDQSYRVTARLVPVSGQEAVVVPTSDGTIRRYVRYAWAEFGVEGARQRLLLLKERDSRVSNRLFLAFRDQTSGLETYGGGRYIDLYQQQEKSITIDFNLAYNPYCVYNYTYSCPLPPEENHLSIPIPAGEKMYPPER
ncbi:MAG: DUF1684 domain-containing protein [Spirochaetaceae bacterium]|nr:MAG: DUF1684 domain-containing protein [Spirochaetaceae bacterium]